MPLALVPGIAQPLHGACKPRRLHRFEQIVHGLCLERLHGILVVGGDEDDGGKGCVGGPVIDNLGGCFQPVLSRHADVEKQHVGLEFQRQLRGTDAIFGNGVDLQFGPHQRQRLLKTLGEQRFVFGDQCARMG
ncbi:hypothetical protein SDC9_185439 [bioreactor metagenome]|uniref:Uncharacterized protein n=1 Tax=bioreactor metagenome TaxID=1076179 RepID=A0A645HFW1_9ZZZZ